MDCAGTRKKTSESSAASAMERLGMRFVKRSARSISGEARKTRALYSAATGLRYPMKAVARQRRSPVGAAARASGARGADSPPPAAAESRPRPLASGGGHPDYRLVQHQ